MRLFHGAATEPGRLSAHNDDFHCEDPGLGLFAVASGSAGGWVGPRTAIRALRQYIAETDDGGDTPWPCALDSSLSLHGNRLRAAAIVAARSVDEALIPPLEMAALLWGGHNSVAVSAVGSCHVYVARTGWLHRIAPAAMPASADAPAIAVCEVSCEPEDRWLICSRGIHMALTSAEIASVLLDDAASAPELGNRLIALAAARDAGNATAVVVSQREQPMV
jgi:serine/threonine protein phosphatase PrpC